MFALENPVIRPQLETNRKLPSFNELPLTKDKINVMEIYVKELVFDYLNKSTGFFHNVNPSDVETYVLNRLSPLYACTSKGYNQQLKVARSQSFEIRMKIKKAVAVIARNPVTIAQKNPITFVEKKEELINEDINSSRENHYLNCLANILNCKADWDTILYQALRANVPAPATDY